MLIVFLDEAFYPHVKFPRPAWRDNNDALVQTIKTALWVGHTGKTLAILILAFKQAPKSTVLRGNYYKIREKKLQFHCCPPTFFGFWDWLTLNTNKILDLNVLHSILYKSTIKKYKSQFIKKSSRGSYFNLELPPPFLSLEPLELYMAKSLWTLDYQTHMWALHKLLPQRWKNKAFPLQKLRGSNNTHVQKQGP